MKKHCWILVFSLFFVTCSLDPNGDDNSSNTGSANLKIRFTSQSQLAKMAKTKKIQIEKLYIILSTNNEDTIRDSVTMPNEIQNEILRQYGNLKANKEWTVTAKSFDKDDSLIHYGSQVFTVKRGENAEIMMVLLSRFFSISGRFFPVDSSISKCEISVNDSLVKTVNQNQFTRIGDTVIVDIDYIPVKNSLKIRGSVYATGSATSSPSFTSDTVVTLPWYSDNVFKMLLPRVQNSNNTQPFIELILDPTSANTTGGRIGEPVRAPFNGHYYDAITVLTGISWNDAKNKVSQFTYKNMKGHLAVISSSEENTFVFQNLAAQSAASALWLGGYQDPVTAVTSENWNWVTGETPSYFNWSPGEPNDKNGYDERYLSMWTYSGRWNDSWGTLQGYIIEYEPTPQQ